MPGSCGSCALGETLRSNVVEDLDDRPPEHARHPARLGRAALDRFDAPIAPRLIVVPSIYDDDVFGCAIEQPLGELGHALVRKGEDDQCHVAPAVLDGLPFAASFRVPPT